MAKIKFSFFTGIMFFIVIMLISARVKSQSLPSFEMKLSNGKIFSSQNLSRLKPLIIIYFAPDCEHCQVLMDALFKRINEFKNAQLVMVTFKPLDEVVDFEKHYQTYKYPNIKVGTEIPVFFFRKYYQVENTPFTVLYNKDQKLVIYFKKETPVEDLIKHLKQLS